MEEEVGVRVSLVKTVSDDEEARVALHAGKSMDRDRGGGG